MNSILMLFFRVWCMPVLGMFFAGDVSITQGKIDIALSQFALAYRNNAYIAELLFPRVPVDRQSDKYWKFGREGQRVSENTLRAPGAPAEGISQTISTDNYLCSDHSLSRIISDEERGNFQAGDIDQWATGAVTDKLLLDEEIRAAALATASANYPAGNVLDVSGTTQWNAANSKPIDQVLAGHLVVMQSGKKANTLILPAQVLAALKTNSQITSRVYPNVKANNIGPVTTEDLASIFEVEQVVVPSAVSLAADLATASFVWGKHAILAYIQPNVSMLDPSFGKTFVWTGAPGTAGGFATEIGRLNPPSRKSDELAVHFYYGQKITSPISAYLLENAVP